MKLRALLLGFGLLATVGCTSTTSVSGVTLPFKVAVAVAALLEVRPER